MSTDISPLATVQQKIQDRIKAEFVSLIPEEMWTAMVDGVITDFTTDKPGRYNSDPIIKSPMKALINDEIGKLAKEAVMAELAKIAQPQWDERGQKIVSEAIKQMVSTNYNEMLASINQQMVEMAVMMAVNNLRNSLMR